MEDDATILRGRPIGPITNGLQGDYQGIKRVRETGRIRRLSPLVPSAPVVKRLSAAAARLLALLVLAGIAAGTLPASAPAAEKAATVICWKRLLNDWFDGRIDQAYPVRCYREAIAHLPEDVDVYSTAREDIQRALLAAIRSNKQKTGKAPTEATPVKPPAKKRVAAAPVPGGNDTGGTQGRDPDGSGPLDQLVATGSPNSADSVPLPLIVLAALALLLLAAAGAGVVSRRLQARKAPVVEEPPPAS
jgi:hypothetical protein